MFGKQTLTYFQKKDYRAGSDLYFTLTINYLPTQTCDQLQMVVATPNSFSRST